MPLLRIGKVEKRSYLVNSNGSYAAYTKRYLQGEMRNELTYQEIDKLFKNYLEWENEFVDSKNLHKSDIDKSTELIIQKLDSKDTSIRYIASHMILTFQIEKAKEKLIERILDKDTFNSNGTMTYALSHLNCQNYLVNVFEILATQSYESKMHAYSIMSEQKFEFTEDDLNKMTKIWNQFKESTEGNKDLDEQTIEMVKDGYQGYISYLDNQE